jgi:type IV secretory pathway VirB3-like protein
MNAPTRRDRLRPVELLGISAIIAVFVGLVVLMSTRQLNLAVIFLCIAFIVVVVVLAMLQLASTSEQDDNDMLGGYKDDDRGDGNGFH